MQDDEQARLRFAKVLWEEARAVYGKGFRAACVDYDDANADASGNSGMVRVYEGLQDTINGNPRHSISRLRMLLRLPRLAADPILMAKLETLIGGGAAAPDFETLSVPWRGMVHRFIAAHGESDNNDHLGPIISLIEWVDPSKSGLARLGLAPDEVTISERFKEYEIRPEAIIDVLKPTGNLGIKYCLVDREPVNTRDGRGRASLIVARTSYETIYRCDAYYHSENNKTLKDPALPADIQSLSEAVKLERRLRDGSLEASKNTIPYALTLFYTIILADNHVLLMKRTTSEVAYYGGTIEPSGGEQLHEDDLKNEAYGQNEFDRWVKRAVLEEYFPTEGLRGRDFDNPGAAVFGRGSTIHLQAIGFNVLDGSFPIFALVRSPLTIDEYHEACRALKANHKMKPKYENEGRRGWVDRRALVEGIKQGTVEYQRLRIDGGGSETSSFALSSDLHPMTLMRFYLLWRSFPNWWNT